MTRGLNFIYSFLISSTVLLPMQWMKVKRSERSLFFVQFYFSLITLNDFQSPLSQIESNSKRDKAKKQKWRRNERENHITYICYMYVYKSKLIILLEFFLCCNSNNSNNKVMKQRLCVLFANGKETKKLLIAFPFFLIM